MIRSEMKMFVRMKEREREDKSGVEEAMTTRDRLLQCTTSGLVIHFRDEIVKRGILLFN